MLHRHNGIIYNNKHLRRTKGGQQLSKGRSLLKCRSIDVDHPLAAATEAFSQLATGKYEIRILWWLAPYPDLFGISLDTEPAGITSVEFKNTAG